MGEREQSRTPPRYVCMSKPPNEDDSFLSRWEDVEDTEMSVPECEGMPAIYAMKRKACRVSAAPVVFILVSCFSAASMRHMSYTLTFAL